MPRKNALSRAKSSIVTDSLRITQSSGLDRHGILHKGRIRKLMPIECWRLQEYSDEQFNKAAACGLKDGHLYKMAGNSVSVPVISAIGQRIKAVNKKYEIVR